VRYDPRGVSRSRLDGPPEDVPIDVQADDAHRVLLATGTAPAALFGSSGGGQTGLALVARHPERVRVMVAHEPPATELLPRSDRRRALAQEVHAIYRRDGVGPAMQVFRARPGLGGRAPSESGPPGGPPPEGQEAMARTRQNLAFFLAHTMLPIAGYAPDTAALRAAASRVVVGVGADSGGQLAHDTGLAVAARLGTAPVPFPGWHAGYLTHPAAFARRLREVLQAEEPAGRRGTGAGPRSTCRTERRHALRREREWDP
jgi:pimeloyl-ACP methyl ester carboxylesterase